MLPNSGWRRTILTNLISKLNTNQREITYNISRTKQLIGWAPKTGIDQGLQKTLKWHLKNKSSLHLTVV